MSIKRELAEALGEEYKRRKAVLAWLLRSPRHINATAARIEMQRVKVNQLRRLLDRAAEKLA